MKDQSITLKNISVKPNINDEDYIAEDQIDLNKYNYLYNNHKDDDDEEEGEGEGEQEQNDGDDDNYYNGNDE